MTPPGFNHVGITVPDLDAATVWYRDVLGCYVLVGPTNLVADESLIGQNVRDIFGPEFRQLRIAHLTTIDGVGLELFEFVDPVTTHPANNFEYNRTGIFHLCLTVADLEGCLSEITASGGTQRSQIWRLDPQQPYRVAYCEDPWGTIIELSSHPYSQTWANRDYAAALSVQDDARPT
jgi:catechol 2,3-dioxygenase-like lactoylglutathione lyase family enzyme